MVSRDNVGFATLKPSFAEASAQLVELMRGTLRNAQEIALAVGDAEATAQSARAAVASAHGATTDEERRVAESERERLIAALGAPRVPVVLRGTGKPSTENAGKLQELLHPTDDGFVEILDGEPQPVAAQLSQEIEATVMWVQQLLECVHFTESDATLEPGASLRHAVQPRLQHHQRDEALRQSLLLFGEKKEIEQDVDEHAASFRRQALQSLAAQPRTPA